MQQSFGFWAIFWQHFGVPVRAIFQHFTSTIGTGLLSDQTDVVSKAPKFYSESTVSEIYRTYGFSSQGLWEKTTMSTHSPQLNIRPAWNQTAKLGTQIYQSVWPEDVCTSGRILAIKTSPLSLLCVYVHEGFIMMHNFPRCCTC